VSPVGTHGLIIPDWNITRQGWLVNVFRAGEFELT